jgi:hypothetical protein
MKATIEPNNNAASLMNLPAVIVGNFVALYTTAIAAANGSSHSIDRGSAPIFSGMVKLAIIKVAIIDILSPGRFRSVQMS